MLSWTTSETSWKGCGTEMTSLGPTRNQMRYRGERPIANTLKHNKHREAVDSVYLIRKLHQNHSRSLA